MHNLNILRKILGKQATFAFFFLRNMLIFLMALVFLATFIFWWEVKFSLYRAVLICSLSYNCLTLLRPSLSRSKTSFKSVFASLIWCLTKVNEANLVYYLAIRDGRMWDLYDSKTYTLEIWNLVAKLIRFHVARMRRKAPSESGWSRRKRNIFHSE